SHTLPPGFSLSPTRRFSDLVSFTLPPKSSTAMRAASTEPLPVGSAYGPDISVRTPMRSTGAGVVPLLVADSLAFVDALADDLSAHPPPAKTTDKIAQSARVFCLPQLVMMSSLDGGVAAPSHGCIAPGCHAHVSTVSCACDRLFRPRSPSLRGDRSAGAESLPFPARACSHRTGCRGSRRLSRSSGRPSNGFPGAFASPPS